MSNHLEQDRQARQDALNVTNSYIVQAPAGSGKTEILTLRFMRLLTTVTEPESVLAITFTRKAASEMKDRILQAIEFASHSPEPNKTDFLYQRWSIAKALIAHDQQNNWYLLQSPNRLQIITFDALAAKLVRQLPVLSGFGQSIAPTEQPFQYYELAVESLFKSIRFQRNPAFNRLQTHLDNNLSNIKQLIIQMLTKREQWLSYTQLSQDSKQLRSIFECGLEFAVQQLVCKLFNSIPSGLLEQCHQLLCYAAAHIDNDKQPELHHQYIEVTEIENLDNGLDCLCLFKCLAHFCLTNTGTWRRTLTKRQGLPSAASLSSEVEKQQAKSQKELAKQLLEQLTLIPGLDRLLMEVNHLPTELHYTESQWQIIAALVELLPLSVAHLKLIFTQHEVVDFIEINLAASQALGYIDQPSDLAMRLDYQIQHMLIDEFQDTSIQQFHLIEKLVSGWQPTDQRTLFLVGDPMQSIYRFRQAEVGLFLKAKQVGIADIYLDFLALSQNFRSTESLVNWNNQLFATVFPANDDLDLGHIKFSPAFSNIKNLATVKTTTVKPLINCQQQAGEVVATIKQHQDDFPNDSIAILTRNRSQLLEIIMLLEHEQLAYQATDVFSLHRTAVVQDLFQLTKALTNLADRTAWFSILRAPWCGLTLTDLDQIANYDSQLTVWQSLQQSHCINTLSADGKHRIQPIIAVLQDSLKARYRSPTRNWIEITWHLLTQELMLYNDNQRAHGMLFLQLIEQYSSADITNNIEAIGRRLKQLYANNQNSTDNPIQLMTIHKSKGLEFDCVILPFLEKTTAHDKSQLLLWQQRASENRDHLLLAPIRSSMDKSDPIYDYLAWCEKQRQQTEVARLLYVATTRAKKTLYLLANISVDDKPIAEYHPPKNSLLHLLWPQLKEHWLSVELTENITHQDHNLQQDRAIHRVLQPIVYQSTANPIDTKQTYAQLDLDAIHQKQDQIIIGQVIHHTLAWIADHGIDKWQQLSDHQTDSLIKRLIYFYGETNLNTTQQILLLVKTNITNTINDPKGQWILTAHQDAQSEFDVQLIDDKQVKHYVIDRTFIHNNIRWIIDYKTVASNNENQMVLLKENYLSQLESYARIFAKHTIVIKLGIYCPTNAGWIEWQYDAPAVTEQIT